MFVKSNNKVWIIGINLKISGIDTDIPLSPVCYSKEEFDKQLEEIRVNLNEILSDAENRLGFAGENGNLNITSDMTPSDIWNVLEKLEKDEQFVAQFNILEKEIREAVAEHILTKCNIFIGKASVFSSRYNESTKYIE